MYFLRRLALAATAALLAAACGADVGEAGTRLAVDEDLLTSEVLYVLPDVSEVPFTERELAALGIDESETIPVRVEVFEDIAVAWFAPDGEARIGRDWIVALWRVQRTPLQNDVAGSEAPQVVAATGAANHDAAVLVETGDSYDIEAQQDLRGAAEVTIIEFWDRLGTPEELQMLEELYQHHPGC